MEPKEKAEELVNKCWKLQCNCVTITCEGSSKQYALFTVDEIISVLRLDDKCSSNRALVYWWLLVKEEIKKL